MRTGPADRRGQQGNKSQCILTFSVHTSLFYIPQYVGRVARTGTRNWSSRTESSTITDVGRSAEPAQQLINIEYSQFQRLTQNKKKGAHRSLFYV